MSINAKIVLDSMANGHRLTTFVLEYPRFIHSEVMTHRALSKNAASSRAIPITKMIERIKQECAMPVEWGMNNPGMQSKSLATEEVKNRAIEIWESAMFKAIYHAELLSDLGIHKQIANRLLEPFAHMQVILSGTEFDNFFALRTHPDAQPEFQVLAKLMKKEYDESVPKFLYEGEWHSPLIVKEDYLLAYEYIEDETREDANQQTLDLLNKISVARCARVSYGLNLRDDYSREQIEKDIKLYEQLKNANPIHASPFEHVACAMMNDERYGNFIGWKQNRQFIEELNK